MNRLRKIFLLITFIVFFVGIISPIFVFAAEPPKTVVNFCPQINIPGIKMFDTKTYKCEGEKDPITGAIPDAFHINPSSIAELAAGAYKFIAGIAGIAAVIVMMAGGYVWLFAGGNASKVGEAKSLIGSAVLGLVLVLGSYMILNLINPELIKLKSLDNIGGITGISVTEVKGINTFCSLKQEDGLSGEGCGKTLPPAFKNEKECMRTSCYTGSICRVFANEGGGFTGGECVKSVNILKDRNNSATSEPFSVSDKKVSFTSTLMCGDYETSPNILYSNCGYASPNDLYTTCTYIQQTVDGKPRGLFISGLKSAYWYNKSDKNVGCFP